MSAGAIRAGGAFVELFTQDGRLNQGLARAEMRLRAFASFASQTGGQLLRVGAGAGVGMFLATKVYADFSDQLQALKGVTTGTQAEFDRLSFKARELGRTTSFTAGQVAGAMVELGRAGFSRVQIDQSIAGVLDLARATGTELPLAAEIAAAALRGFGLDANEMQRVADVLTATANASATTLEDLGEAVKYVAPLAAETGESIENVSAALGVLANNGIKGSLAGNALARAYKNLSTTAAQQQLRAVGVDAVDAAGNIRPLATMLVELGRATANWGNAAKLNVFEELFGRGQAAALKLAASGAVFDDLQAKLDGAAGTAARTSLIMDEDLGGAVRRLLSAVEGIAIAFGAAVAPTLSRWGDQLTTVSGGITAFIESHSSLMIALVVSVGVITASGAALIGLGMAAGLGANGLKALQVLLLQCQGLAGPVAGAFAGIARVVTVEVIPSLLAWVSRGADAIRSMGRLSFASTALKTALVGALAVGVWTAFSAAAQAEMQATQRAVETMTAGSLASLQRLRDASQQAIDAAHGNDDPRTLQQLRERRDQIAREKDSAQAMRGWQRTELDKERVRAGLGVADRLTGHVSSAPLIEADIENLTRTIDGLQGELKALDEAIARRTEWDRKRQQGGDALPPAEGASAGSDETELADAASGQSKLDPAELAELAERTATLQQVGDGLIARAAAGHDPQQTAEIADRLGGDLHALAAELQRAGLSDAARGVTARAEMFDDLAGSLAAVADPARLRTAAEASQADRLALIDTNARAGRLDVAAELADAAAVSARSAGDQLAERFFLNQAEHLRERNRRADELDTTFQELPNNLARATPNRALELGSSEAIAAIVSATSPEDRWRNQMATAAARSAAAGEQTARHADDMRRQLRDAPVVTAGRV